MKFRRESNLRSNTMHSFASNAYKVLIILINDHSKKKKKTPNFTLPGFAQSWPNGHNNNAPQNSQHPEILLK
jgi:hypothetical protein